jgi:hypothetical protein
VIGILYISRSRLGSEAAGQELSAIVAVATRRNLAARVTGALVYSGTSFAQWLEGPEADVDSIIGDILVDPRHEDIRIVMRSPAAARRFPAWSMVLVDEGPQTERQIDAIRDAGEEASQLIEVEQLIAWMEQEASARVSV